MATAGGTGRMRPVAPDEIYWFISRSASLSGAHCVPDVAHVGKTLLWFSTGSSGADVNTKLFLSRSFLASRKRQRACHGTQAGAGQARFPRPAGLEHSQ